jgi:23S rRNA (uracil1939-C5)-methyltransferase
MQKIEQLIPFKIKHIDSLGQGVSHYNDQVSFIPKTLPDESGEAIIYKKSKKVQFAQKVNLLEQSCNRIVPECPHFEECTGCSFLHTDYSNEMALKATAAKHQLKKLGENLKLKVTPAKNRFHYRNRVQLHYDLRKKKLGLINNITNKIVEVPHCKLPSSKISQKINALYENQAWIDLVKNEQNQGHLELQQRDDKVELFFNEHYASGGFTQVNDASNKLLLQKVSSIIDECSPRSVMDLFGGNGNLSSVKSTYNSWIIDNYDNLPESKEGQTFISQNIYHKKAIQNLSTLMPKEFDLLIIDPPRSGLKNINEFCLQFDFKHIIYISCFYPNMIRDLLKVKDKFSVREIEFFDFFPGTHHLEVLTFLTRK